jgi:Putative phage tail protein
MARLALTIAGAAAGAAAAYFTGNVQFIQLGMSLGALAGGLIAQLVLPGARQYGPRVTDLAVMSSAPGQVIPRLWGTMRLGGQVIWSSGLQETSTTSGGKGGPSQTTYSYTVSFAAGICQGPAQITRIWGDSKLVYNKGGANVNNRGTWNGSTTYNVNDLVAYTDPNSSNAPTLEYICLIENIGQVPTNGSYWAEDLVDSSANVTKYNLPTIYQGTETQNPDPTIVAAEGADLTPAYRGLCYILWEDFPLADFGNRLPNIRAEVTSNGTSATPVTVIPTQINPTYVVEDNFGFTAWVFTGPPGASGVISRIDLGTNTVVASGNIDMSTIPGFHSGDSGAGLGGCMTVDNAGNLWGFCRSNGHPGLAMIDPWTFKAGYFFDFTVTGAAICNSLQSLCSFNAPNGRNYLVGYGAQSYASGLSANGYMIVVFDAGALLGNTINVLNPQTPYPPLVGQYYYIAPGLAMSPPLGEFDTSVELVPLQSTPVVDPATGNCYFIFGSFHFPVDGNIGDWIIVKVAAAGSTTVLISAPYTEGPLFTDTAVFTYPPDSSQGVGQAMFWNKNDGTLIVMTNTGAWLRIDPGTGKVLEQVGSASEPQFNCTGTWPTATISGTFHSYLGTSSVIPAAFGQQGAQVLNGILIAPSATDPTHLTNVVSTVDFSIVETFDPATWPNVPSGGSSWPGNTASNSIIFDAISNSMLALHPTSSNLYRVYLDRISTAGLTADIIVGDICALAGLPEDTYNTSALAGIQVEGYVVSSLSAAKDMISTLGQAFFFEGRESDFVLEFVPRGESAVLSIPETDLGQARDNAEVTLMLGQEQDVPKSVEVAYIDPYADFQQGSQKKIRHSRTKKTLNLTSVSLPLVMTSSQAAQLAQKLMWTAESERRTYSTNFWKATYMLLDPCDVIQFAYHGMELQARVTESTIGQNFVTAMKWAGEDSNTYVSTTPGNNGGFVGQVLATLLQTVLFLLDIPYLQDTDADAAGNSGYYFAMAPAAPTGTWPSGVLYQSTDNASYTQVNPLSHSITYGVASNILGVPQNVEAWDRVNTLTLRVLNGTNPGSDTQLNVLNGTNVAILFPSLEIIQFTTVTDNLDGTITLSGLLRGRRGTEWATTLHTQGEKVLFPLTGGIRHQQIPLSSVGLLTYYRGITVGNDVNSGTTQQFVAQGRDLKPYSVTSIVGTLSGSDWTVSWLRRTRLGGSLQNGIGTVPLNEDGQGYSIDILAADNVTVVRTVTVTTNSVVYTAAQQTADFGSTQSTIRCNVYQLSGQVGRGYVQNAIISSSRTQMPVDTAPPFSQSELGDIIGNGFTINGQ